MFFNTISVLSQRCEECRVNFADYELRIGMYSIPLCRGCIIRLQVEHLQPIGAWKGDDN